ncbi:hypothetical protein MRX96_053137 [Rhipicephalus microplus]
MRDSACAALREDSADGAAITGVREPNVWATGAFESVEAISSAPQEPYEVLVPVSSPRTEERSPSNVELAAPVQQSMLVLPQKHAVHAVISGRRRPADRHHDFFEKRLALEAELREREAALEERRLSIEEGAWPFESLSCSNECVSLRQHKRSGFRRVLRSCSKTSS